MAAHAADSSSLSTGSCAHETLSAQKKKILSSDHELRMPEAMR